MNGFRRCFGTTAVLIGLITAVSICPGSQADEAMLPREIVRTTVIVKEGKSPAVIVYPTGAYGRTAGQAVRQAIRDVTGVDVSVRSDDEVVAEIPAWPAPDLQARPLILLGNISNNRAILPLYANGGVAADVRYPGGDGYTLRTVVDPYGTGINEIVLEASTDEGLQRAVRAFAGILREHGRPGELTLPSLLEVVLGREYADIVARTSFDPKSWTLALDHGWTGRQALLELALKQLRAAEHMKPEARSYSPSHYGKECMIRNLIALMHSGALTPDEINHLDNILLRGLHDEYDQYWIVHEPTWLGTRHQTVGTMGFLVTADYLLRHARPNEAAGAFLQKCVGEGHAFFRQFEDSYRDDGNDNTSFDSVGAICRYMLTYGNTRFFRNGIPRLMARRALVMNDNRGWFVGPGNYEDARPGRMMTGVDTSDSVCIPSFVYRDRQLRWIMEHVPGMHSTAGGGYAFSAGVAGLRYPTDDIEPEAPDSTWQGLTVLPLQARHYEQAGRYFTHGGSAGRRQDRERVLPRDRAVEMVAFRDRFEPAAPYLFLMGYQGGRYDSIAANAILRYADRGHIWLASQTEQAGHYFRNALHIGNRYSDDYLSIPGAVRLDASAEFDDAAMTATTLPGVNQADWTRHVLWCRGRYFVVIDTATFLEDGDYDLTCTWQSLPIAAMENGIWTARFLDWQFELHNADGIEQRAYHERGRATEQMCVHPYVLRQHTAVRGREGEHVSIRNMFYTRPRDGGGYRLRPVGRDAVVIFDGDRYLALAGVTVGKETTCGPLATEARMFLISTESVRTAPESSPVRLHGRPLDTAEPGADLRAALLELWAAAAEPSSPPEAVDATAPFVERGWSFDGLAPLYEEIGGVKVIEPQDIEPPDMLFDRQIRLWSRPYEWPGDAQYVTYDLGRVEDLARIRLECSYDVNKPGAIHKDTKPVALQFSNDNFRSDIREATFAPDQVYRAEPPCLDKPYTLTPWIWLDIPGEGRPPIGVKARYVRTPARATYETVFYRTTTRPAEIDWLEPVDLDGDGEEELAVATEARELAVLKHDGSLRFKTTLEATATCLMAADLAGDGKETLFVTDNGWRITGYDAAGGRVFQVDGLAADLRGPYALGTVLPQGAKQRYLVVATGHASVCLDPSGQVYCTFATDGIVSDTVLRGASSAPRAQHRTATRNAWGSGAWRDVRLLAEGEPAEAKETFPGSRLGCHWWLGLGLAFWPERNAPDDWRDGLAVFVARAGVNAYDLGAETPSSRWSLTANGPVSSFTFADMDESPGEELLLGRRDGFINIVDRTGRVIGTWTIRAPVMDVRAWAAGRTAAAVATGDSLRFHDRSGNEVGRLAIPALRLAAAASRDGPMLVCAGRDGKIVSFKPSAGGAAGESRPATVFP